MTLDGELLRRYAETKSEEAFAELVRRHVNLVYSAALRQVNGDAHLAQDVAQAVFTDLARKAAALAARPALTGWLYTSTHFAAAKAVRAEQRRRTHEQQAQAMHELLHAAAPDLEWEKLRPTLDVVMQELKEAEREVILMRYFENRAFGEIGTRLDLSEDAARKRVDRALEKLRAGLLKRGITTTVALGTMISANAIQAAPAGLAATLTSAALAGAAAGTGTTFTALKMMIMTKSQTAIAGTIVVASVLTTVMMQQHNLAGLQTQHAALEQQAAQLAQAPAANEFRTRLVATVAATAQLPTDEFSELLRLRSEAGTRQGELERLRAELVKAQSDAAARAEAAKSYFPKSAWASAAGGATPESALLSAQLVQAQAAVQAKGMSREGLKALVKTVVPPGQQEQIFKEIDGDSDKQITDEIDRINQQFEKADGLRIVNKQVVSDDEVTLTFMNFYNHGTNDSWGRATLKRYGNTWR